MFAERVAEVRQTRARRPEMVAQAAAGRKRAPAFPGRLVLIAADHTARGILRAGRRETAMADRAGLLERLCVALGRSGVDGVLGTADVLEDLLLLGALEGKVVIGSAPRLGEFGFEKNDDAVEGVILMRTGEQAQNVLKGVEAKTEELNHGLLPPDVKVDPYYDRSDLVRLTTDTVEANLLRGMVLVLIVLLFFLVSARAAIIVALTIPLGLLFAFIFLHERNIPAN